MTSEQINELLKPILERIEALERRAAVEYDLPVRDNIQTHVFAAVLPDCQLCTLEHMIGVHIGLGPVDGLPSQPKAHVWGVESQNLSRSSINQRISYPLVS